MLLKLDLNKLFCLVGCTRLLLYFNTNKPNSFFFLFFMQNTSCIRKPQVISGGGTPYTLPLDPPLRAIETREPCIFGD